MTQDVMGLEFPTLGAGGDERYQELFKKMVELQRLEDEAKASAEVHRERIKAKKEAIADLVSDMRRHPGEQGELFGRPAPQAVADALDDVGESLGPGGSVEIRTGDKVVRLEGRKSRGRKAGG